ncbi:MAG: ACT domain-containing protein [Vitreoscilla sp.]
MPSAPISDLATLLASMRPELHDGIWAWCSLPVGASAQGAATVATMREAEGLTVVVAESDALTHGWPVLFRSAWITLAVHSDLAAVGLTAAFARALGDAGISCNVIAGVHHDHLFVPVERAADAMTALLTLQARGAA